MRLDPVVALARAAAAPGESLLGGLHELLFPRLYPVRRRLEALGDLGQRALALNEGLWVLRVRLDMGLVGLIVSEQVRNTTP